MAELTAAELETKIAAIDTQIDAIVAAPTGIASYSIGQKSVSRKEILGGLIETRKMYQKMLDSYPAESYQRMAISTSDQGEDDSEYLGDS